MCIELRGIKVRLGFASAAAVACLLNSVSPALLAAGTCGVLLHELTHLVLMRSFGCGNPRIEILPGGVRIVSQEFETLGYRQAAVCLLGAPAVNLLLGAALYAASGPARSEVLRYAAFGNLALGAVNLLPMPFLDGGRALECLLCCRKNAPDARALVRKTGLVCLLLMTAAAVVLGVNKIYPPGYYLFIGYCLVTYVMGAAKKSC